MDLDRRRFLQVSAALAAPAILGCSEEIRPLGGPVVVRADGKPRPTIVDTHMHVWAKAKDAWTYPFPHPYQADFQKPPHEATVEMLDADMEEHGCTHAVLVQVIYHGWNNNYIADCVKADPERFRGHGLIDPTAKDVAEMLEYWITERGLHGMRFSPIYYKDGEHGGDDWITAEPAQRAWKKAAELGAVFNYFIAAKQLPKLAEMKEKYPEVPVIIDHLSQIDLAGDDPEPEVALLLGMAKHPNVYVKVSELSSVSKSKVYPFADAYPFVQRVYDAFGPDRLLFGTGYPGAARAGYKRPPLDQEIELFEKMQLFTATDRAKILGGNAAKLWKFDVLRAVDMRRPG